MPVAHPDRARRDPAARIQVLVVDADEDVWSKLERRLEADGLATSMATDGEAALAEAMRARPDVVLSDLRTMHAGLDLCQRLHEIDPDLPVIAMAGSPTVEWVIEAFRLGAEDCLVKPLDVDAIVASVTRAIARRDTKCEAEGIYRTLNQRLVLSSVREHAHAEAEAQQREQLSALLGNLSEGVVIVEPSGRVVMLNGAARGILGVGDRALHTVDALHWTGLYDLAGQLLDSALLPVIRALRGEQFAEYEVLRISRSDVRRHIVSTGTCVRDDSGSVALAIVVFRDVTELRALERRHDQLEADATRVSIRLASAIESVEDAFAIFDEDDRLFLCNVVYRGLLRGSIAGPLVGKSYEELLDGWIRDIDFGDEAARVRFRDQRLARRREEHATPFDVKTVDGRRLRVVDRRTPEGGIVTTIWDLTDEERRAGELRAANALAEAANAAKSEFLSSMSHELRTPLNAILGFTQLLRKDKKEPPSDRHKGRLDQILSGGEHLLRLIDDILDLSRIEAGGVSVSPEPVSVDDALRAVMQTLEPSAARQGIRIEVETPVDLPMVLADRTRLLQILMNFGSNAVKYNRPQGTVTFSMSAPCPERVRVTVRDTGMGIPTDKQAKIFQPFQRAGQENGPIAGTGIGLVISKRLAQLMGGDIGFRSVPGAGSEFWVDVPRHSSGAHSTAPPAATWDESAAQLAPDVCRLVLYVEDSPANTDFMKDLMSTFQNVDLLTASTAEAGLELARARRPELIIMDVNLPGMSGLDALRALRGAPETESIPVIALTAAASELERQRGVQSGFHRYLTKPVKVNELVAVLEELLGS
jgi:signal transduction histidine kinase/DNA-binding response OmpR family regulator